MHRQILRLAIPNILNNLTVPLLGIVDTVLMGRLDDPAYLGAIALGGSVFSFLYWGFGFLRMGTVGLTGQALGANDRAEILLVLLRALLVGAFGAVLVLLLQVPIAHYGLELLGVSEDLVAVTREYVLIRIWAAPAVFALYALQGWFLGMQNARYPLYLAIVINGANILFNLWFVRSLGMTSDGVALGTVLAQYLGLLVAVGLFSYQYRAYLGAFQKKLWRAWEPFLRFFQVSGDIFLRTLCLIIVFTFFNVKSAQLGEIRLDANHILFQFFYLLSFGVDGFAYAAESLVGKYLGQRDASQLREMIRLLLRWGTGLGLGICLIYGVAESALLRLFTDQTDILIMAEEYYWWMIGMSLAGTFAFLWDGIYIGATATQAMRNTMFIALLLFGGLYWGWPRNDANAALWAAMTGFMAARSGLLWIWSGRAIMARVTAS